MRLLGITLALAGLCTTVQAGDLLAIKAPKVYVGNGEVLHHAVILVEDGKIVTIDEDLPIDAGIPILELDEDHVVMPGLINPYSRLGSSVNGPNGTNPQVKAGTGFYPNSRMRDYLEAGVVAVGYYPPGRGIPGQAAILRTGGVSDDNLVVKDSAYLKLLMRSSRSEKERVASIYSEIEKFEEKEAKNKEKYEKAKEKAEKTKDKDKKKAAIKKLGDYKPLKPDAKVQAFMDVQSGKLPVLVSLGRSADYLHFVDALDDKAMEWSLRLTISRTSDFGEIKNKIGEKEMRVIMDPTISVNPGTIQQRNLPAEFVAAGAKLVLLPRSDSTAGAKNWFQDVAIMIRAGLDEQVALSAMTLEAAHVLGVGEMHGSLEVGKVADLLILDREPFEVGMEIDAVMVNGKLVHGEVGL